MKLTFDCFTGLALEAIGHAADMIWIGLVPSGKFEAIPPAASIALHLQCETDIFIDSEHITGTDDIYQADHAECLFEKRIAKVLQDKSRYQVESAVVDDNLNLSLQFSNGLLIQTATDELFEPDDERWRVFIGRTGFPHLVAMGDHMELY